MPKRSLEYKFEQDGYERISEPNNERIAELTKFAMGDKNMSEFAKSCGLSVATISRVVGNKFTSAIADGIIKAIIDGTTPGTVHSAAFIDAQGYRKKGFIPIPEEVSSLFFFGKVQEVICEALAKNGYDVEFRNNSLEKMVTPGFFDFEVRTNALAEHGIDTWMMDVMHMNGNVKRKFFLERLNSLLAMAYLNSFREDRIKVSLVTDTKECLDIAREKLGRHSGITDVISIIYIDPVKWTIEDEYQFPLKENDFTKKIFNP